jgi:hypothetical protein
VLDAEIHLCANLHAGLLLAEFAAYRTPCSRCGLQFADYGIVHCIGKENG